MKLKTLSIFTGILFVASIFVYYFGSLTLDSVRLLCLGCRLRAFGTFYCCVCSSIHMSSSTSCPFALRVLWAHLMQLMEPLVDS